MRKVWMIATAMACLAVAAPPQDPPAYGAVYHLSQKVPQLLEMQTPRREQVHLQLPVNRDYLVLDGPSSPVRLTGKTRFVVRYRMPGATLGPVIDPASYTLYPLQTEKERRLLILEERTPVRTYQPAPWPVLVSPYGPNSASLEPGRSLPPGEYALLHERENPCQAFCFGVDASASP